MFFLEEEEYRLRVQYLHLAVLLCMGILLACAGYEVHEMEQVAQIVNRAGLVRGRTQLLVKQEIAGRPTAALAAELDDRLEQLDQGVQDGADFYIDDGTYMKRLAELNVLWQRLKEARETFQQTGDSGPLLAVSEEHFDTADAVVNAAEHYSFRCGYRLFQVGGALAILILVIFAEAVSHAARERRLQQSNQDLRRLAYLDVKTSLPNKTACERVLEQHAVSEKCAGCLCMMMDLNDLKRLNDSLGHEMGDVMIASFAHIIELCLPEQAFVGRWGGDEFIAVFHQGSSAAAAAYIAKVQAAVDRYNAGHTRVQISFAYGWSLGDEHPQENMQGLLAIADQRMYENKRAMKAGRK